MTIKKSGEDVVHHILAFGIVVQKYGGQPIHLTVMLFEQLLEFLWICHTLLIHTKTDLLNPKRQLFFQMRAKKHNLHFFIKHIYFCQRSYKKSHKETLGEPENWVPRIKV
jgi:hypothetical protein